jgi:hypothetical protein
MRPRVDPAREAGDDDMPGAGKDQVTQSSHDHG